MIHIFSLIILIFATNSALALKDCPGDMVLWRQPGSNYSDCVCPTGQSMVANIYDVNLHTFGKCSDSYIPLSKTWAADIGPLRYWFNLDDPFGNGYRDVNGATLSYLYNNVSGYNTNYAIQNGVYDAYNSRIYLNTTASDHTAPISINLFNEAKLYFFVINYSDTSKSYSLIEDATNNFYIKFTPSNVQFYNGNCSGATKFVTSPTATVNNANQIVIVYSGITFIRVALINANTGYNNSFNSAAAYVQSVTGISNCLIPTTPYLASYYTGYISEMLMFRGSVTDAQITQILSILNQKWQVF